MKPPAAHADVAAALLTALSTDPTLGLALVQTRAYVQLAAVEAQLLAAHLTALPPRQLAQRVAVYQADLLEARTPAQVVARAGGLALAQALLTAREVPATKKRKKRKNAR